MIRYKASNLMKKHPTKNGFSFWKEKLPQLNKTWMNAESGGFWPCGRPDLSSSAVLYKQPGCVFCFFLSFRPLPRVPEPSG